MKLLNLFFFSAISFLNAGQQYAYFSQVVGSNKITCKISLFSDSDHDFYDCQEFFISIFHGGHCNRDYIPLEVVQDRTKCFLKSRNKAEGEYIPMGNQSISLESQFVWEEQNGKIYIVGICEENKSLASAKFFTQSNLTSYKQKIQELIANEIQ